MKKLILLSIIFLYGFGLYAQRPKEEPEHVKALRVAIYTQVLELTADEAEKFWPLHNEFQKKVRTLKEELHRKRKSLAASGKELTDEELTKKMDEIFDLEVQIVNMQRAHMKKLMEVIPAAKVVLIPKAEEEFKKALLDQIRRRQKGMRP